MARAFAEIAFSPAVRAEQKRQGSAKAYAKFLAPETERGDTLSEREADFIGARDGFFQATISESGWPYVQFRGGPAGFVKVLDAKTMAYADYRGNRQYISVGNLAVDTRIALILVDYPNQSRLKVWGRARLVDVAEDPALINRLHDRRYRAKPERAVIITIDAFDWNCPQHIPQRLTLEELEPHLAPLHETIAELQAENEQLRAKTGTHGAVRSIAVQN